MLLGKRKGGAIKPSVKVLSVQTVDRMFTTTHLSDHVQDYMTSRLHKLERVGAAS